MDRNRGYVVDNEAAVRTPIEIVQAFFAAAVAKDIERCRSLMHDDIVSQLVPFPEGKNRRHAERTLRRLFSVPGTFKIDVHHIAEHGSIVLTQRTDSVSGSWLAFAFWVCGTAGSGEAGAVGGVATDAGRVGGAV